MDKDGMHNTRGSYLLKESNPDVYSAIQIQVETNLIHLHAEKQYSLQILPELGGWFTLLVVIFGSITKVTYPIMMYISIIIRLFKVDPNKGQRPRNPLEVEKIPPGELIKMAKKKVRDRRPIVAD